MVKPYLRFSALAGAGRRRGGAGGDAFPCAAIALGRGPAAVLPGFSALAFSILRNYPVLGHMRFLFEGIRPEIRQYLIESDRDEEPFSRDDRSLVYQRAKNVEDARPFGTRMRVYDAGYQWLTHSIRPRAIANPDFRVTIGGPACAQPYDASIYNISAMSFGALSGAAIEALNRGAARGGFAHDTGEGGISCHHRAGGGDLIYEIGSGYFGCRTRRGGSAPSVLPRRAGLSSTGAGSCGVGRSTLFERCPKRPDRHRPGRDLAVLSGRRSARPGGVRHSAAVGSRWVQGRAR